LCTWPPQNGTCSTTQKSGTTFALNANLSAVSLFGGWGPQCGICSGLSCNITLTSDAACTATFTRAPNARINTTDYSSLTDAYKAAQSGDTIQALATELVESLTMNLGTNLLMTGGYKADYNGPSGNPTTLKGMLTIGNGSLTVEGLAIR
jgi:hypothetical protein